jgi:hypothetical protein
LGAGALKVEIQNTGEVASTNGPVNGAHAVANKAMEGSGFYNRNSDLQAAGIELALPLFEEAARTVQADEKSETPLVIADYGSSQGRNSMRPMRLAIDTFRSRFGSDRPIEVVHTDLPSNDFASGELLRFTAPTAGRRIDDLQAPFRNGPFCGLTLEHAVVLEAPDPFWDEYVATRDAAQLGRRWSGMMRAVSGPIAAAAFAARTGSDALVDELYRRFEHRITAAPQQNIGFAAIAVVCKAG